MDAYIYEAQKLRCNVADEGVELAKGQLLYHENNLETLPYRISIIRLSPLSMP